MKDLLDVLKKITELLYQERVNQAYDFLVKCLPHMGVMIGDIQDETLQREIMDSLTEAVGAMEENDYTLLADILQYDVIEKIESMGEEA